MATEAQTQTCEHCDKKAVASLLIRGVRIWFCRKHCNEFRKANAVLKMFDV